MITVGIASIPARVDNLERVLDSLTEQVDTINLVLNGYEHVPEYLNKYKNVWWWVHENEGDAMKFALADAVDGYYFSCDDDLKYPPYYCRYMISKIDKYKCICTLHGRRYDERPITSFARNITTNVRCLNTWDSDIEVHVGGSGCMAYHTDFFKLSLSDFPYRNMADIQVALAAKNQGVKIVALSHPREYLEYLDPGRDTISKNTRTDKIQTEILNKILQ
jgi:hypothetical protein